MRSQEEDPKTYQVGTRCGGGGGEGARESEEKADVEEKKEPESQGRPRSHMWRRRVIQRVGGERSSQMWRRRRRRRRSQRVIDEEPDAEKEPGRVTRRKSLRVRGGALIICG